jgi:glycerol-3-phosphate dehydrogenase
MFYEEAKADIQMAENNQQGTSRRHFLVDIDPKSLDPRMTVLGGQTTIFRPNKSEPLVLLKD